MLATTDHITIPAVPGPLAERWCCSCGRLLGFVCGGFVFSRHKGREVVACLPARVQCDGCGRRSSRQNSAS